MKHKIYLLAFLFFTLNPLKLTYAQAPPLGVLSGFSLFTSVGAFTNTGPTITTDNIGTDAGLFSGFPPGTSLGQIHLLDSLTNQASIDASIAYNNLFAKTCGSVIGTSLGNNQVLVPDVYCIGGSSTINGTLILDGLGDPNALFIIKIDGSLSTSTFAQIVLVDSANYDNVYWQINGSFTLGDSALMFGTILSNGAIELLEGSSLFGRGISVAGAISLHSNLVGIRLFSPLPVELINFNVEKSNSSQSIDLHWQTCSEQNSSLIFVQKSSTGKNFSTIGFVKAQGSSNAIVDYKFKDNSPFHGTNYYRLKMVDINGTYEYSSTLNIQFDKVDSKIVFYPNPFNEYLKFSMTETAENDLNELMIYNSTGILVFSSKLSGIKGTLKTDELPTGFYTYSLLINKEKVLSDKLVLIK